MSGFIVSGGALLEIGCPSELVRETQQQVAFTRTLGGKRKAFIRRGGRRSWSIDVGLASPGEVSTIEAVARYMGEVGWYGPDAVIGNMLSPQASGFEVTPGNATDSGLVSLPDGSVARSVAQAGSGVIAVGSAHRTWEWVPAPQGSPVTVSAWGRGGLSLSGSWRDANGVALSNFSAPSESFSGWQWRSHSANPPTGAVYVTLNLSGGAQYALPSVSWGATAKRMIGSGCPKAIVHSPSVSALALWPGTNVSAVAYSITEVG